MQISKNNKINMFDNSENRILKLDKTVKGFCCKKTNLFLGTIVLTEKTNLQAVLVKEEKEVSKFTLLSSKDVEVSERFVPIAMLEMPIGYGNELLDKTLEEINNKDLFELGLPDSKGSFLIDRLSVLGFDYDKIKEEKIGKYYYLLRNYK